MRVVSVVVTGLYHLDIGFGNGRFLGKLLSQEVEGHVQVATKEPAHQSESKHVATLHHGFLVHAAVGQTILHHLGDGTGHHAVRVNAHFFQRIIRLESRFHQVFLLKAVRINNDGRIRLGLTVLCLQSSRIHGHQHITPISRCVHFICTYMHLKSRHTRQRSLRGTDIGRIVRKRTDAIAYGSRDGRENISRQLHTVTRVTGKENNDIIDRLNFHFCCHNLILILVKRSPLLFRGVVSSVYLVI